ncbi:MAG: hypothetical protein WCB76_05665 [Acidobacteriaceae bacterium]
MYDPVARFLRTQGYRLQLAEMPFYEYRIDIYSVCKKRDATAAVELKLSDWRRALDQALLYQLCADFVYVAMPIKAASRLDMGLFAEHCIGLIGVEDSGRCQLLTPPGPHTEVRYFYKQSQIDYLKDYSRA